MTSGSNGTCEASRQYLCHAGAGYDGPTGNGTPDGTGAFASTATGNVVTITDPGVQDEQAGTPVFLAMQALDSAAGQTLTYSADRAPVRPVDRPGQRPYHRHAGQRARARAPSRSRRPTAPAPRAP